MGYELLNKKKKSAILMIKTVLNERLLSSTVNKDNDNIG